MHQNENAYEGEVFKVYFCTWEWECIGLPSSYMFTLITQKYLIIFLKLDPSKERGSILPKGREDNITTKSFQGKEDVVMVEYFMISYYHQLLALFISLCVPFWGGKWQFG